LDVTRASNTVADVVEGVTFELSQETASEVQVTVSADTSAMVDEVQSFVDAYNSAVSEMQGQVQEGGRLRGDSLLIATRSRLRLAISNPVEGMTSQYDRLSAIGITTEQDGTLVVDEAKLQEVYEADPQALEQVFFDESDGIKARVEGMLDPYLETAGVLDTREDYLQGEIGRVQDQMERLQDRLEMRRESLYREFTAMERMVSNLQNQGNALMAQLGMSNNQG
jgi:flagellar hook-associated protein 2